MKKWISGIAVCLSLAACGGGGDSGGGAVGLPAAQSSSPVPVDGAVKDQPGSEKAEAPSDIQRLAIQQADQDGGIAALRAQGAEGFGLLGARSSLARGREIPPTLKAPQAGSTAAVGNDSEGVYEDRVGYTFITADGAIVRQFTTADAIFGSIAVSGVNWTFNPGTVTAYTSGIGPSDVVGLGTFSPKSSMEGRFGYPGSSEMNGVIGPLPYSIANALAVSQASIAGQWTSGSDDYSVSITVDATGAYTGTLDGRRSGPCDIRGAITQSQPGSAKNMFSVWMKAENKATAFCYMNTSQSYTGLGAIVLVAEDVTVSTGYTRKFTWVMRNTRGPVVPITLKRLS